MSRSDYWLGSWLGNKEAESHKCELDVQTWVDTCPVSRLTLSGDGECIIEELQMTFFCLLPISDLERIRKFQKGIQTSALAYDEISHM